jgi:hypothetical protein
MWTTARREIDDYNTSIFFAGCGESDESGLAASAHNNNVGAAKCFGLRYRNAAVEQESCDEI